MGGPLPGVRRDMGSGVMEISRKRREHKERHCHFTGPEIQGVDNAGRNCRYFRPPAKAGRRSAGGRVADIATHRPHLRFVTAAGPVLRRPAALRHSQKRAPIVLAESPSFDLFRLGHGAYVDIGTHDVAAARVAESMCDFFCSRGLLLWGNGISRRCDGQGSWRDARFQAALSVSTSRMGHAAPAHPDSD